MVMNSTVVNGEHNSSKTPLIVDTAAFNGEDFTNFLSLTEEIERNERLRRSQRRSRSSSQGPTLKATMTREEIFECSTLDDDKFLTALEYQNSYVPSTPTHNPQSDISHSIENLMKYFDEEVPVDCRSPPMGGTPTKIAPGKVAAVVANFKTKSNVDVIPSPMLMPVRKHQTEVKPTIKELKKKYESPPGGNTTAAKRTPNKSKPASPSKSKSPKGTRKSKVKQIAEMFNVKITQIMRRDSDTSTGVHNYAPLHNELSPEPKPTIPRMLAPRPSPRLSPRYRREVPVPSPRTSRKQASQNTPSNTCLVAEDVFRQLSVKDKALLYNKFIGDMSKKNPKFGKHAESMQEHVKKEFARGEVVMEKQETVKHLTKELEAKCTFPKHTISPHVVQRVNLVRDGTTTLPKRRSQSQSPPSTVMSVPQTKAKEAEDIISCSLKCEEEHYDYHEEDSLHISTLTVVLKPSPDTKRSSVSAQRISPKQLPRTKRDVNFLNCLGIIEPTQKRNNESIRSSFSTEAYAPPKKIRRTRAERLTPKMFFQNQHLERLFYSWLKEKNGVSFDITSIGNMEETIMIAPETELSGVSVDGETQKSAVDKLLEEAIAKLETVELSQNYVKEKEDNSVEEKEVDTAIATMADKQNPQKNEVINEKTLKVQTPVRTPRKKKPAPPIPTPRQSVSSTSNSSAISSAKQSEAEESESGLSSNPKITTDDSQPESNGKESSNGVEGNDFDFVKPVKPPRKKKMRRTLTWKKENSIIESQPALTTDSDSDYKSMEPPKKPVAVPVNKPKKFSQHAKKLLFRSGSITPNSSVATPQLSITPQDPSFSELDRSLMRVVNSPRKIKSAYTLTIMSSPSPHTESDYCESELSRTPCRETSRSWPSIVLAVEEESPLPDDKAASTEMTKSSKQKQHSQNSRALIDSFIDQGFETGSNEIDSPKRLTPPTHQQLETMLAAPRLKLDKSVSPLFIKLKSELEKSQSRLSSIGLGINAENPCVFSTPVKGHVQQSFTSSSESQHQVFSPIAMQTKGGNRRRSIYESESRRNSLAMQVIREDQPLDQTAGIEDPVLPASSPDSINANESHFFANAPTVEMASQTINDDVCRDKISSFWICAGDFTISMDIFHNSADRLRLLYDIFCQKSSETRDLHFGIDDHKFSVHNLSDKEDISKRLPKIKGCSHYWFSTGDLAVPFSGKYMSSDKIKKLFNFINEAVNAELQNVNAIRFGVDNIEFSSVPEFWQSSPKFSIESSYQMLVGLQSGTSNGLEGRSKYAWPNSMCASTHSNLVKTSDLDHSEFESEEFDCSEIGLGRLSFSPFGSNNFDLASLNSEDLMMPRNSDAMMSTMSPEMFTMDYENEPLDQLFADAKRFDKTQTDAMQAEKKLTVPEMIETLQLQQKKLKTVEKRMRSYTNPSNLSSEALEQFKDSPQYVRKLQSIIAAIDNIGRDDGFKACSMEQLESFMFFLSRYADLCLANCSEHMDRILDALMDQRAVTI